MLLPLLLRYSLQGVLFALLLWAVLRLGLPRWSAAPRGRLWSLRLTAALPALTTVLEVLQRTYAPPGGGVWRVPVALSRTTVFFVLALGVLLLLRAALLWLLSAPSRMLRALRRRAEKSAPAAKAEPREEPAAEPASEAPAPQPAAMDRREWLYAASTGALAAGTFGVIGYGGLRVARDLQVREVELHLPGLPPALEGMTLVQLTDIHVGLFTGERDFAAVLERANALRADAMVLTGDLVDNNPAHVPEAMRLFARLRARWGVFGSLGNHDYFTGYQAVWRGLERAGVRMLVNQGVLLPEGGREGVVLAGLDDLWAPRAVRGRRPDLRAALRGLPPDGPRVVLAHNPKTFDSVSRWVGLMLSGHTHGGQVNPMGIGRLWLSYIAGHYERDGGQLFVSTGLGLTGPPVRFNAPPEVVRIALTGRSAGRSRRA